MGSPVNRKYQFDSGRISPELEEYAGRYKAWKAGGKKPTKAQLDHLERATVELGGSIPARFEHLQHLNRNH